MTSFQMKIAGFFVPILRSFLALSICFIPVAKADQSFVYLDYLVEWNAIDLGHSTASWVFDRDSYQLISDAQTQGAGAFFFTYYGESELSGQILRGPNDTLLYAPQELRTYSKSKKEEWNALTNWPTANLSDAQTAAPTTKRTPELDLEEVFPLDNATLPGSRDPFSIMLNALAQIARTQSCVGTYKSYDGRRRTDFQLYDLGQTELVADRPTGYSGPALICGMVGKPIGGHSLDSDWDDEDIKPDRIRFYIAEMRGTPADGLTHIPVRIEIDGFLGDVIVRLNLATSQL